MVGVPRATTESEPALELLVEPGGLPSYPLPDRLAQLYPGTLGFTAPCVVANFVASVDGVAALGHEHRSSGSAISGGAPADRFVMGLLRACADAILIGAGTLRGSPGHAWTPEHVWPRAAGDFSQLRRRLGRADEATLVVVSRRGDVDPLHPGLRPGTVVLTGDSGARRLRGHLPGHVTVRSLGEGELSAQSIVGALHADGHGVVLSEGGPILIGQLVAAGLVDELFLTVSPALFGRDPGNPRQGIVDAVAFAPDAAPWLELYGMRRHGSHVFLRYAWPRSPRRGVSKPADR
jgi:riboflavin biosynthesis pyrimidine reductase